MNVLLSVSRDIEVYNYINAWNIKTTLNNASRYKNIILLVIKSGHYSIENIWTHLSMRDSYFQFWNIFL